MNEYTVSWVIDEEADTPEEAARQARARMLNPGSTADIFRVQGEEGDLEVDVIVDLSALDGQDQAKGKCPHCEGDAPLVPNALLMCHGDRNTMQGDCLGSRELPATS